MFGGALGLHARSALRVKSGYGRDDARQTDICKNCKESVIELRASGCY